LSISSWKGAGDDPSAAARAATTLDVTATPLPARSAALPARRRDVVGFALRRGDADDGVIWISGDTVLYEGVRQVARRLRVDIALLHSAGCAPDLGPAALHDDGAGNGSSCAACSTRA